jgi:toxin ParE1/3/4
MRIRLSPQARTDLDDAWFYVARESGSGERATHIVAAITDKFALFARFPFIGKSFESAKLPNIRSFPFGNHVIFYSTRPNEIRILRIIHASRDAWAVFTQE